MYKGYGLNNPGFEYLKEQEIFFFPKYPKRLCGWVCGGCSPGVKRLGLRLTTHLHLVPRLRITGASPPLPPSISATLFHS
jgi:hypothetical protein